MLKRLRAYLRIVTIQLKTVSHFRANVLAWVLYSPLQLAIIYLLWKIVFLHTDQVGDFDFKNILLYYLVVHFLRRILEPVQTVNFDVWSEINEGKMDVYLARPVSFGYFVFCRSLGEPIVEICVGLPFFLFFAMLMGLPMQWDPTVLAAFAVSIAAGYMILFFIQFIIGSLTFWMGRVFGLRDMIFSVFILFSGQLIPISVLPDWVGRLSGYLPFQNIYYVPAQIYQAEMGLQVTHYLLQEALWVGILWTLAALIWSRGVARYASQGG